MTTTRPPAYPIALRLEGRLCVVIGTEAEVAMRVDGLLETGARVRVVSERPPTDVEAHASAGTVELRKRGFDDADLDDAFLAVLVDQDEALAERISDVAERRRVLFCAIDQPRWNSFAHVAVAKAGPVRVSVSSSGQAPTLAKRLREELERAFAESGFEAFVERVAELRDATPRKHRSRVLEEELRGLHVEIRWRNPE